MYEEYRVTSGRAWSGVPAWGNALDHLEGLGVDVCTTYRHVLTKRDCLGESKFLCPNVYFANKHGEEVAYWTEGMNVVLLLPKPRRVDPSFMRSAKFLTRS